MPRVKRGVIHAKRRRNLLKKTKGYKWGQKKLIKRAHEAVVKAGVHAYVDRKKKKRNARGLWQIRIGAFVRSEGISYSRFIAMLKVKNIELDRKVMAQLAIEDKDAMKKLVELAKS